MGPINLQLAAEGLRRTKDATVRHAWWCLAMHPDEQAYGFKQLSYGSCQ